MSTSPSVVKVAFPTAVSGLYDYAIPGKLRGKVTAGAPVLVELNRRRMWGMAVRLTDTSDFPNLKDVLEVKQVMDTDTFGAHTELYEWMASYYQCSLGAVFRPFVRKGLLHTDAKRQMRFRFTGYLPESLTRRQREAAESLRGQTSPMTRRELGTAFGLSDHLITALAKSGVLNASEDEIVREADELRMARVDHAVTLTDEQRQAVATLKAAFDNPARPFLLHGITGSGKTHVYIELVRHALARGRAAIVLVPEISLTPQTIQRFAGALGDTIAVIHSHMSDGERRDSLEELVSGRKRVVIGVRSAILAPLPSLGLIVVDEEHDGSYKQSDTDPRYHARDVAVMRGRLQKALVVLGSATPSLESYHNAQSGKYTLVRLAQRFGRASLPRVSVVDMTDEHRAKNWTFVSRYLEHRLAETLHAGRQAILLLNRRGFSTFLICKDCGETYACPNCSVRLVYHRAEGSLRCHQCGHFEHAPTVCPACRGEQLQYKGTAIQ
ncbi:MAG: primosomal protein N', partial [Chitinivibrionales bacterium]|nr:primosomal protein N' [Chitinivibrionales bacterium]